MEEIQCTGRPTAPIITRYRCFLPDLAGLAGLRRVGPGTVTSLPLQNHLRSQPIHTCALPLLLLNPSYECSQHQQVFSASHAVTNSSRCCDSLISKGEAMNRRSFLAAGAASLAAVAGKPIAASAATRQSSQSLPQHPDNLNPPGIQTAGIRMVPVVGGKYKVWTKRMGSGPIKVLLLHGGPGFSHEYLEAMESFLPQAGIEIYYYDQLGCNNSDHPDDPSLWTTSPLSERGRRGPPRPRARQLHPLRPLLGRHPRHGVCPQLSAASTWPRHLQHDRRHQVLPQAHSRHQLQLPPKSSPGSTHSRRNRSTIRQTTKKS